jgi:hypothetical protein
MKRIVTTVWIGLMTLLLLSLTTKSFARKIYSNQTGDWSTTSTWKNSIVPVAGDTVIIKTGHTVSVSANLYSNSTYMFLIIVGTLDLTNNGKISLDDTAKVIIETGGRILGNGNNDQLSIGSGGAEYKGGDQGNITGPAFVSDGHSPTTGEGTAGCGCYTPGTIPLPVRLKDFDAVIENGLAVLRWTTILEKNFKSFNIERSTNGKDFTQVGSLNGQGFNIENIETNYTFTDHSPISGFNYYRLKAIDFDNTFEYFGVKAIQFATSNHVIVFPNPIVDNSFHLNINFQPGDRDMVYVYDNLGILRFSSNVSSLENSFTFTSALERGNYLLRYASESHQQVVRFSVK